MATHDYVIANGTGAAVRSDINGALAAIVSQNSNASAPATTYAYMSWADTTAGVMKMRNGANSAWISLYELDGTFLASDISLAAGSAAAPSLFFTGDTNTGLFSPGADTVALATAGSNRLHITSGGLVGIGTTGPVVALDVVGQVNSTAGYASNRFAVNTSPLSTTSTAQSFARFTSTGGDFYVGIESSTAGAFFSGSTAYAACLYNSASTPLQFFTGGAIRATLNSTGLGIGTTSPSQLLHVKADQAAYTWARIDNQSSSASAYSGLQLGAFGNSWGIAIGSSAANSNSLTFVTDAGGANSEKARFTSDGKLLVGTSTNTNNIRLQQSLGVVATGSNSYPGAAFTAYSGTNTAAAPIIDLKRSRGTTDGSMTAVGIGDFLGYLAFNGADGTNFIEAASIIAVVDGTPGTNDMPGRLVFSTTADGAASPTERMRITNAGIIVAKTNSDDINIGGTLGPCIASTSRCGFAFSTNSLLPTNGAGTLSDNGISLGLGSYRWSVVYAGTGTINTSDANLKQDIDSLSVAELTVAANIKSLIKKFRFKDAVEAKGDDARIHVGVIAQEVAEAFVNAGLDPYCYGLFCEDELEDGSKRLGIRYDELLAFVIASL